LAAILDFASMAPLMSAGFGALKKWIQYVLNNICAKFHPCTQICTIPPNFSLRAWTNRWSFETIAISHIAADILIIILCVNPAFILAPQHPGG